MLVSIAGLWPARSTFPPRDGAGRKQPFGSTAVAADLASEANNPLIRCDHSRAASAFQNLRTGSDAAARSALFLPDADLHRLHVWLCVFTGPPDKASSGFGYALFVLGFGGGEFPRSIRFGCRSNNPTECRASALAFATSFARLRGSGNHVSRRRRRRGTLARSAIPVALTAIAFIPGILLLPLGFETRGKPLPS